MTDTQNLRALALAAQKNRLDELTSFYESCGPEVVLSLLDRLDQADILGEYIRRAHAQEFNEYDPSEVIDLAEHAFNELATRSIELRKAKIKIDALENVAEILQEAEDDGVLKDKVTGNTHGFEDRVRVALADLRTLKGG